MNLSDNISRVAFGELLEGVTLMRGIVFRLTPFGLFSVELGITAGSVGEKGLVAAIYILNNQ